MNVWCCRDCQTHNCDGKYSHPYKTAKIDANILCIKFWNSQSETISQEGLKNFSAGPKNVYKVREKESTLF